LADGAAARNEIIAGYKRHASARDLEWQLSEAQLTSLFQGECHWCGEPPSNRTDRKRYNGAFRYNGIDRVDNASGYVASNVVSCCIICNSMKRDFSREVFLDRARKITARYPQ
jgi:hypothetical protein